jgi:hypothetical protein
MMTEATPEEWEEFNRVERESKAKQESIRGIKYPTREQLVAEVAVLTELVRVLSDRVAELEGASNTLNEMRRRYDDHFARALGVKK